MIVLTYSKVHLYVGADYNPYQVKVLFVAIAMLEKQILSRALEFKQKLGVLCILQR